MLGRKKFIQLEVVGIVQRLALRAAACFVLGDFRRFIVDRRVRGAGVGSFRRRRDGRRGRSVERMTCEWTSHVGLATCQGNCKFRTAIGFYTGSALPLFRSHGRGSVGGGTLLWLQNRVKSACKFQALRAVRVQPLRASECVGDANGQSAVVR